MGASRRPPAPWGNSARPGRSTSLDQFLARSESVAAALVSRSGDVLEVNDALVRVAGHADTIHDVIVAEQAPLILELILAADDGWSSAQAGLMGQAGDLIDCTFWATAVGGHVMVLAEQLYGHADRLTALLLELNEDLVLARRELTSHNRWLHELDELKDLLLASATHDLKQPMMALVSYAEMLRYEDLSPEAERMVLIIERNARRTTGMIDDMLAAATIMTGGVQLDRRLTDLASLVGAAVDGVQPAAQDREVVIEVLGPAASPVYLDEGRVLQILDNLLSNAVKYSLPGGRVRVDGHVEGSSASLRVSDTGIGIPVEEQDRLFNRYFRASTAIAHGISGTGHGLANARALAEAHGGSLTCTSTPGAGTTFTLTLPRGSAPDHRADG